MSRTPLKINSIFGGITPTEYFGGEGTYNKSVAVDPDYPIDSTKIGTSGFCVPIAYTKFSSTNITGNVIAIINNPKNTLTYTVQSNGKIVSYDSSLGSETLVGTVAGNNAGGACYYNNYIYIFGTGASKNDVSRYGPLTNSPALTDGVWTGATLGSQAALNNATYPTFRSVSLPNHWGYVHGDNSLYFLDFGSSSSTYPGQGLVHRIHTKKTTDEGDTNDTTVPSAYGVLDLPFGFYPTSICSYGTSLMILGIYTIDNTVNQGNAAFVLWDGIASSFYLGPVALKDPLGTALLQADGNMYIWTGNAQNGHRLSRYVGGQSTSEIEFLEEGFPPLAGAVDALGNRIVWGSFTTDPVVSASVYAYGSKTSGVPQGLHNIARCTSASTNPFITALKFVQQSSNIQPKVIMAWKDDSTVGIDKYSSSATLSSVIRFLFNVGQKTQLLKLRIPFGGVVAANTTITPKIYLDNESSSVTLTTINNTNYSGSNHVTFKSQDLKDCNFNNNFILEFTWTGTNPLPIALPINMEVEIKSDEPDK